MSVSYLDNRAFLKRVLTAMQDIDTLTFETIESALTRFVQKFGHNLLEIIDVYENSSFETSAAITSLSDRILEKNNKDFLDDLKNYINDVDLEFNNRSAEYGKLCSNLQIHQAELDEKEMKNIVAIFQDIVNYEKIFEQAIIAIRKFSQKKLKAAKKRKLMQLPNYKYEFTQLQFYGSLTLEKAISFLIKQKY